MSKTTLIFVTFIFALVLIKVHTLKSSLLTFTTLNTDNTKNLNTILKNPKNSKPTAKVNDKSFIQLKSKHDNDCDKDKKNIKEDLDSLLAAKTSAEQNLEVKKKEIRDQLLQFENLNYLKYKNEQIQLLAPGRITAANSKITDLNNKIGEINSSISLEQPELVNLQGLADGYGNDLSVAIANVNAETAKLTKCQGDFDKIDFVALNKNITDTAQLLADQVAKTTLTKTFLFDIETLENRYQTCLDEKQNLVTQQTYEQNGLAIFIQNKPFYQSNYDTSVSAFNAVNTDLNRVNEELSSANQRVSVTGAFVDYCTDQLAAALAALPAGGTGTDIKTQLTNKQNDCIKAGLLSDCARDTALLGDLTAKADALKALQTSLSARYLVVKAQMDDNNAVNNAFISNLESIKLLKADAIAKLGRDYAAKTLECPPIQQALFQKNFEFTSRNPSSVAASEEIEEKLRRTLRSAKKSLAIATKLNQEGCGHISQSITLLQAIVAKSQVYFDDSKYAVTVLSTKITDEQAQITAKQALITEQQNLITTIQAQVVTATSEIVTLISQIATQLELIETTQTYLTPYVNRLSIAKWNYETRLKEVMLYVDKYGNGKCVALVQSHRPYYDANKANFVVASPLAGKDENYWKFATRERSLSYANTQLAAAIAAFNAANNSSTFPVQI